MSGPPDPAWYPPLEGAQWGQPVDLPEPESEPAPVKRNWLVPVSLAVGVAGISAAITVAVVWWPRASVSTTPTSSPAPVTVQQVAPTSSAPDVDGVSKSVRSLMQQNLDTDADFKGLGLRVVEVKLVHKGGNEFKGIAMVRTSDGVSHEVPVDVTADGVNVLWETPKGAFSFLESAPAMSTAVVKVPPPPPSPSGLRLTALDLEFIRKLRIEGFTGSSEDLVAGAVKVCYDLAHGRDLPEISEAMAAKTGLTVSQAHLFASDVVLTYPTCHG